MVSDVGFSVDTGQVVCLLGQSGCGKSTILRMIAGVDEQDAGWVRIDGKLVAGNGFNVPPEKRSVGLMFQDYALFPHLSVAENIAFGLVGERMNRRARIKELLEKIGLYSFRDQFPHELSGGEQQRVALARALAPRPRIMLLDEPFSSFDDRLRDELREETLAILRSEGAAVLLVTHLPSEAMRVADKIVLMREGRIVQQGTPFEIYNSPADRTTAGFFSDLNVIHGVVDDARVTTVFGEFDAAGLVDGADVEIVIRPQHVRMDFDRAGQGPSPTVSNGVAVRGVVLRSTFLGNSSMVEFEIDSNALTIKAVVPTVFLPKKGHAFWLSLAREKCFLFPCTVQSRVSNPYTTEAHAQ